MMLNSRRIEAVTIPPGPPILLVSVDTEEEFDWGAPFSRKATAVTHLRQIEPFVRICQKAGVRPCYLVDYPVVADDDAWRPLAELIEDKLCEIGAHLHPWVTPPFRDEISVYNSYPGNLPSNLEYDKLHALSTLLERRFHRAAITYRAGRYGVGQATSRIMEELGFLIDTSVVPRSSFRADGGPDFRKIDARPYWWHGGGRRLLELPLTVGWLGYLRHIGPALQPVVNSLPGQMLRVGGVLSRAGLYERIRLSPEGATFDDLVRLTDALLERGQRVFNFSFHSPSLAPGHTPYVRTQADVDAFLGVIDRYFQYFADALGGYSMTPAALREQILASGDAR